MFIGLFAAPVGRDPVAVPEKIFGLTLILDFFDRCHSLVSLPPPQAAVNSLPTGRAETRCTIIRSRRGDYQSPVALPLNNTIHRYYGTNLPLCSAARSRYIAVVDFVNCSSNFCLPVPSRCSLAFTFCAAFGWAAASGFPFYTVQSRASCSACRLPWGC